MNHDFFYTVGAFAKLHNMKKRTLQFYDEIGLFCPVRSAENGYRLYSYLQSPTLEMILTFRELGMSIAEICSYMKSPSIPSFCEIANKRIADISKRIEHLTEIKNLFMSKVEDLCLCRNMDLSSIEIVESEEEKLLVSQKISGNYGVDDFAVLAEHMQAQNQHRIFALNFGCMIAVDELLNGTCNQYHCYFTKVKEIVKGKMHIKPKGKFVRAFCVGEWENLQEVYKKMIAFAKANNLILSGYAYEQGMNEIAIKQMNEYITQILIPCHKCV